LTFKFYLTYNTGTNFNVVSRPPFTSDDRTLESDLVVRP